MAKLNSIKFKISVFYTALLAVILVLYTGILFYNLRFALYRDIDNDILIKAQEFSSAINSYMEVLGNDQRDFDFATRRAIRLEGVHPHQDKVAQVERTWLEKRDKENLMDAYVDFVNADRSEALLNSVNMEAQMVKNFIKDLALSQNKALSFKNVDYGNYRLRVVSLPFYYSYKNTKQVYLIQVGVSRKPIFKILYGRLIFAAVTIPLVLLIASFLGGVITDRVLKPIMEITRIARNITHKDLSVRVKAERVEEELQYLVDAFNEMISRLDKSFRYIAEFSSNVAHELKTPLTIIRGESELALMQDRDCKEYQRVIEVNLEETEGMLKIVEDLLLLSKLEYQPEAFNFESFDFNIFMANVFEQAKKMAVPKNILVELTGAGKPVLIHADSLHLRRMFLNLVNNAIKFTPEGGRITLSMLVEAKTLKVSVSDTGIGIKPQDIDKVFRRFFHIDNTAPSSESGTGLGLSIAQSIARIHSGDISVTSKPGRGSTFTVTLPLRLENLIII